ncbi:MAG TPA: putative sugar nucleotidyl transferase [Longimicrobium sp.]|jgi:UDP-N-acetylglucosamine diphosphorylase/glucosamine-1-phosphate N-acetyltransferase|uniref:putative sugar nucleotidyl transferase n=1 Tax=Longimicrobium sp. TaxID=2029185 RepID=UPI002EDB0868
MPDLSLILFDDAVSRQWHPFALTRPGGELRFGAFTGRARAERLFGARCVAHLGPAHLAGFEEGDAPAVVPYADAPTEGDRLFLSARAVPAWGSGEMWRARRGGSGAVVVDGEVAGWFAPAGTPAPEAAFFDSPPTMLDRTGAVELPGHMIREVWELMSGSGAQTTADVAGLFPDAPPAELPAGAFLFGDHALVIGERVRIEPGVVFDLTKGPVWLDDGVQVKAFTRMAGPAYVGRGSIVLGGALEEASIGEGCRIRGEFAESVCLNWVNKAHDGHIGHAYLGAWVNLGAETTNSDLKNNYGTVRLWTPSGERDTGEIKVGCFLGDHVKTGIGLLLNTGTVVGAGSNLFGAAMPPKYVPPFSWGTGDDLTAYRVDKFLDVAKRAMARRNVELSDEAAGQLRKAWEESREQSQD